MSGVEPAPGQTRPDSAVSEDLFRLLVSQVKDYAIFVLDPNGRIVSWNEGAARIKGYHESEIVGRHFSVFYSKVDVDAGKPEFGLELAARDGRFEDDGWRLRKDGTRFWANVVITALRDESGRLRGFAKVTRDMTTRRHEEQRRLAAEAEKAQRLQEHASNLEKLEQAKSDFLNLASHELRGPVGLVRGYLSMIEDEDLDLEQIKSIVPVLIGRVANMQTLIRHMLETARLDEDRLGFKQEAFDLREVAHESVSDARHLAGPGVTISVTAGDDPVMVRADRVGVGSIAANLLDNAIKYSRDGGSVGVIVSARGNHAFLTVQDAGVGIASDQIGLLFRRFGRLDTELNQTVGGTGLGLYLSREIARRQGGEILVESRPAVGSRFSLSLPLRRQHQPG